MSGDFKVGDLVLVSGYGQERYVVTCGGAGTPRRRMRLKAVKRDKTLQSVCETRLSRPSIKTGDWVRSLHRVSQGHVYRIESWTRCGGIHYSYDAVVKGEHIFTGFMTPRDLNFTHTFVPVEEPECVREKRKKDKTMSENYLAGDLICFKKTKTPCRMTHIDNRGLIHFNWGGSDAADLPENITRPEFAVGMWVRPRTGYGTSGPKRIGKITADRLIFDAQVSKAPGREGTITEQSCGSTTKVKANWLPVADPDAPEPKEEMVESEYKVGDLVRVSGYGAARYVMTGVGMGKPQSEMCLKAVVGTRRLWHVCERDLTRATIKKGDWIRCIKPGWHNRKRVMGAGPFTISFDRSEESLGNFVECCAASGASEYWVAVETPKEFEPAGGSKEALEKEANRLSAENTTLRKENEGLKERTKEYYDGGQRYHAMAEVLRTEVSSLSRENEALKKENAYILFTEKNMSRNLTTAKVNIEGLRHDKQFLQVVVARLENQTDNMVSVEVYENTLKDAEEARRQAKEFVKQRDDEQAAKEIAQTDAHSLLKKVCIWQDKYGEERDAAIGAREQRDKAEVAELAAKSRSSQLTSDLELVREWAKEAEKDEKHARGLYEAVVQCRDRDRDEAETAQQQVKELEAEVLALHRQLGPPEPRIMM